MVVHTFNPSVKEAKAEASLEFKAILVSSRTVKTA